MHHKHLRFAASVVGVALVGGVLASGTAAGANSGTTNIKYDATNVAEYLDKWANIYGPLELASGHDGTISVTPHGTTVSAVPFDIGADYSVFDHLKYIGVSKESFDVPQNGSLEFSADMTAETPGTQDGRVVHGCYGPSFSYTALTQPCAQPFMQVVRQGQQAGVVLNMINFETGQLFDWFLSGDTAFALIERLPSNVTGSPGTGLDLAYTQIIKQVSVKPGKKHNMAIRYTRGPGQSYVEYFLDGQLFTRIDNVGVPLDKQHVDFTGYAPSLGNGEPLQAHLNSFVIGHGLFSLLDAFPYQHPDAPQLSVSIPLSERLFGQGAIGTWDKFVVTTKTG
jgi:hypothetical protein